MSKEIKKNNLEDFRDFLSQNEDGFSSSNSVSMLIDKANAVLYPSSISVFLKLSVLHLCMSLFTLSVCPQFGFRVYGAGHGLMKYFMVFGDFACFFLCGAFFISFTALAANFVFNKYDYRVIRKNQFLFMSALLFASLGFLIMLNAQVVLNLSIAWITGGLASGILILQIRSIKGSNLVSKSKF